MDWEKKPSRIFWRKSFFFPAPLVICLEFNILMKEAFSWKELRHKQSLIYTSESWGTQNPQNKTQSRSSQGSLIAHPFSFPVAEGICLSQASLAWKKFHASCIPQTMRSTQWKPLQNVTGIWFSMMWALAACDAWWLTGACNSHAELAVRVTEAQVPRGLADLECKLPWGKPS